MHVVLRRQLLARHAVLEMVISGSIIDGQDEKFVLEVKEKDELQDERYTIDSEIEQDVRRGSEEETK